MVKFYLEHLQEFMFVWTLWRVLFQLKLREVCLSKVCLSYQFTLYNVVGCIVACKRFVHVCTPGLVDVILFGNKVFADVIKGYPYMKHRRGWQRDTRVKKAMWRRKQRLESRTIAEECQEPTGSGSGKESCWRGHGSAPTAFRFLASRTVRE